MSTSGDVKSSTANVNSRMAVTLSNERRKAIGDYSEADNDEEDDDDEDSDEDEEASSQSINLIAIDESELNRLDNEQDEREFERIFSRIAHNKLKLNINIEPDKNEIRSIGGDDEAVNKLATIRTSLKYLYKLLKYHRLEHYMNELIEHGIYTPMSLSQLNLSGSASGSGVDLDRLGVASVYDRRKFAQLKQFVRNVVASVHRSRSAAASIKPTDQSRQPLENQDELIMKSLMNVRSASGLGSARAVPNNQYQSCEDGSSAGKKTQLFKKNPNLGNGARNTAAVSRKFGKTTNGGVNNGAQSIKTGPSVGNKAQLQRAKSSEPLEIRKKAGLNFSFAPSKSSMSIAGGANSVNHPKTAEQIKSSAKFFGPKLQQSSDNHRLVRKVEAKTYDYGVPQPQQTTRLLDKKQQKYLEKIGRNLYQSKSISDINNNTSKHNSQRVTSDIYVFARKRPKLECESNFNDVISVERSSHDSAANDAWFHHEHRTGSICVNESKSTVDGTAILRKNDFTFDKTFDSSLTNESIFKSSILPFINLDSNENKIDFTCICFGQTGSGKTHTLFGNKLQDGFCSLTAQYLFSKNLRLFCGFYEIYNGQLYDLLNKNNRLVLREDSSGQLNVVGLVEIEVKNIGQLRKTIEQAQQNRHIGTTSFNKASSRSHAIIQFKVLDSTEDSSSPPLTTSRSKFFPSSARSNSSSTNKPKSNRPFRIMFIDLAGSERGIDAQNNLHDNRKEGAEINQSLLALKECIRCIDQFYSHAPFRQSKLTRVLRDCFIGRGRTVLIATVSPTDDCVSCSLNTLQYANRVRQMTLRNKKKPMANESNGVYETTCKSIYNDYRSSLYSTVRVPFTKTEPNGSSNKIEPTSIKERHSPTARLTTPPKQPEDSAPQDRPLNGFVTKSSNLNSIRINSDQNSSGNGNTNQYSNYFPSGGKLYANLGESDEREKKSPRGLDSMKPNQMTSAASIFHPSKINMSSTPIKTAVKVDANTSNKNEAFLMTEHDTPIKGHKIKYMNTAAKRTTHEQLISQLAEQHFARVTVPDNRSISARINNLYRGDSSQLSDEKNDNNTETKQEDTSGGRNLVPTSSNKLSASYSLLNDDSLNRLRQKQRDMLLARRLLATTSSHRIHVDGSINASNVLDHLNVTSSARSLNDADPNLSNSRRNSVESSPKQAPDSSFNQFRSVINSQKQLRVYIENLEVKLNNLKNEMGCEQQRKKSASNESLDSIKEFNSSDANKRVEEPRPELHLDDDEDEKMLIRMQQSRATDGQSTDDEDCLKKSLHKGNLTDLYFSKLRAGQEPPAPQFSPIEATRKRSSEDPLELTLTPRQTLVNPKPIKLSPTSSSSDSTARLNLKLDASFSEETSSSITSGRMISSTSSRIWNKVQPTGEDRGLGGKWSNILMRVEDSGVGMSNGFDNKMIVSTIPVPYEPASQQPKDLVMVAHQNQLADITETCKKEADLLDCLRGSKMEFDEYLKQVDEMLSRKVTSIKDLQSQINRLRSYRSDGGISVMSAAKSAQNETINSS